MWHNDKSKYSYDTKNIIVGDAELLYVTTKYRQGWRTLCGLIIEDYRTAVIYAEQMDYIIQCNKHKRPRMR